MRVKNNRNVICGCRAPRAMLKLRHVMGCGKMCVDKNGIVRDGLAHEFVSHIFRGDLCLER